jgi:hypothetical protein
MPDDHLSTVAEPNLDSFVLRFVQNGEGVPAAVGLRAATPPSDTAPSAGWHGVIRHVQSSRERAFSRWADAVAFISEFVNIQENEDE